LPIHRRLPGSIASWVAHFMQPARKSQLDSVSAVQRKNRRHFVPTEEQSLKRIADKSRKFALFFVFKKTLLLSCSGWKDRMSKIPELQNSNPDRKDWLYVSLQYFSFLLVFYSVLF
jgi:hypothetical protein